MFCESYRESLKDAAAGAALSETVRLHLAVCANCADAFAEEEQLYLTLDAALQRVANAEVPASLVPGVRVQTSAAPERTGWRVPVLVFASALVVIAALLFAYPVIRRQQQAPVAAVHPANESTMVPAHEPDHQAEPEPSAAAPVQSVTSTSNPRGHRTLVVAKKSSQVEPEVLVSAEEQMGLQQYTQRLRARTRSTLTMVALKEDASAEFRPVEIKEIEFARVTIEPLDSSADR